MYGEYMGAIDIESGYPIKYPLSLCTPDWPSYTVKID